MLLVLYFIVLIAYHYHALSAFIRGKLVNQEAADELLHCLIVSMNFCRLFPCQLTRQNMVDEAHYHKTHLQFSVSN